MKFNEKEKSKYESACGELRGEVKEMLEELEMLNAQGDGISVTMASRVDIEYPSSVKELVKIIKERAEASGKCTVSSKKYMRVDMK